MKRNDISDKLIHFTGPQDDWDRAYSQLKSIIGDRFIRGGNGMIRSGDRCVCFTEAPLLSLLDGFVNESNYSRYSPFGIMVDKAWLFERGGRPVIYQSESEYAALPEQLQWRHVRYEPTGITPIDFTWEREWRIKCERLVFWPNEVGIVVPSRDWANALVLDHEREQDDEVEMYSLIMNESLAELYREDFPWRIYILGN
ncbi:MAG: hypothetical protein WC562_07715 [Dehalococcoidia bacterium]